MIFLMILIFFKEVILAEFSARTEFKWGSYILTIQLF